MLDIDLMDISLEERFEDFKCEDNLLNEFLKRNAHFEHIMRLSRTKLIKLNEKVAGFFTMEFRRVQIPVDDDDNYYPTICLKCLAVDERYENQSIGSNILEYITFNSKDISEFVGCRCLFIDARVSKLKWYKDRGFQFVNDEYNSIDIDKLILMINDATVEMFIDFRDNLEIAKLNAI